MAEGREGAGTKSVVVTGVSSGIGRGAAKEFVESGYRVFGSVRREEDAQSLAAELGAGFEPLLFDVTDRGAVLGAADRVGEALDGRGLDGLVNNAGMGIWGPLMLQPLEEVRAQFEVNVMGLVSVTQAFLPLLGATKPRTHGPGRIVNVGSISGRSATPFMGAYVGAKHAVEGISDSLRRELLPYGVDVVLIEPGPVRTRRLEKDLAGIGRYAGSDYADPMAKFAEYAEGATKKGYSPEAFGRRVREVFEKEKPKTRYAIVPNRLANFTVPMLLPDRWFDRLLGRTSGLSPGAFGE